MRSAHSLDLNSLRASYAAGKVTPTQIMEEVLRRGLPA